MKIVIEKLSINDYDEIIRIWTISGLTFKPKGRDSRSMIKIEMQNSNCCYFGLYKNNVLIGTAIANFDCRRGWVNRVAIDPDFRHKGFAGKLITRCNEFLESIGAIVICALIEETNTPSVSTFNKAGFIAEKKFIYFTKRQSSDA